MSPMPSQQNLGRKDDLALVAEAKVGNYESFEELVNRYEKRIYRLALNISSDPADAEDILQNTFLKAFQHLSDFRGTARFYTWLTRIAINEGLMSLRKRRSGKLVQLDDSTDEEDHLMPRQFVDWGPNPEELYAQEELKEILRQAIDSLSPKRRMVFHLREVEKLSTEETAQLLDLPAGTVKARLHRARFSLRDELSKTFKKDLATP